MYLKALLSAAAVALLVSSPSFAKKPPMPPGQAKKITKSVPGPIAALGLPAGVVIGGYVWWRRRSRNGQSKT
jgi:type IV secretory pathway VirB2 component (pilin)